MARLIGPGLRVVLVRVSPFRPPNSIYSIRLVIEYSV